MFSSIGSLELLVIAIIALLVVGPERLPAAVRTGSLWVGRFRRNFYKIKAEIERELNADEIKRQLHNESVMADLDEAKKQVTDFAKDTEKSVQETLDLEEEKEKLADTSGISNASDDLKEMGELKEATKEVKQVSADVKRIHQNIKKDLSWKNGESSGEVSTGSADSAGKVESSAGKNAD